MSYYNQNEIERQKEDAIRRTREMYSRSTCKEDEIPNELPPLPPEQPFFEEEEYIVPPVSHAHSPKKRNFKLDKDTLILLAIIYLLYREKADKKLILAILYIFL
ncbi:hypothetical protein FACS1894132_08900 [Clostridia bacterium]|nr:hypothetical protein FACS1894132_08900 [Clostridia bacterium]